MNGRRRPNPSAARTLNALKRIVAFVGSCLRPRFISRSDNVGLLRGSQERCAVALRHVRFAWEKLEKLTCSEAEIDLRRYRCRSRIVASLSRFESASACLRYPISCRRLFQDRYAMPDVTFHQRQRANSSAINRPPPLSLSLSLSFFCALARQTDL